MILLADGNNERRTIRISNVLRLELVQRGYEDTIDAELQAYESDNKIIILDFDYFEKMSLNSIDDINKVYAQMITNFIEPMGGKYIK